MNAHHHLVDLLQARALASPGRRAYTFLADGETESAALTWAELDGRARALGAALVGQGARGERVLLLFPPGLDFVAAFFGCLYAGAVAVPCHPPRPHRDQPRLRAIACDARPGFVLTTVELAGRREALGARVPELAGVVWIAVETVDPRGAERWAPPSLAAETAAFLQYTSGSTALPKGVVVTHGSILHNEEMIRAAFGQSEDSVVVGWLPLFHDMGLIGNVLQPLTAGASCVLMPPLSFLQQPVRWLRAIHRYRATTSGGPSFAYELCARKVSAEEREGLDLSSWTLAFNGAEPVRAETLDRFTEAFAPCGFRREAFYPCYGLAEATLFVAGGRPGMPPVVERLSAAGLERGVAVADPAGRPLVGCGGAWSGQRLEVVDPATGVPVAAGSVGEIWVAGPSIAAGYWERPEETARTFGARLADGSGPYLRTGDLGILRGGELFVTGRLKDLIILRGRNHYPQDLEHTAGEAHPALEPGAAAAVAVEVAGEERLVLVLEVGRRALRELAVPTVAAAVRRAIAEEHEVQVHEVVLLRPGTLPRTSSGKVQRHACRAAWLAGGEGLEIAGRDAVDLAAREGPEPAALDRDRWRALAGDERHRALVAWLRDELVRAAGVDPAGLGEDAAPASAGLDSLAAVEIGHRLESTLGIALAPTRWLEARSLGELAQEIARGLDEPIDEEALTVAVDPLALSVGQRGLLLLERLHPGVYNVPVPLRLHGTLDVPALRRSLRRLIGRHPQLAWRGEAESIEVRVEKVEGLAAAAWRPFDLDGGPLLRAEIFPGSPPLPGGCECGRERGPGGEGLLLLTVHHIAVDFWSLAILVRELSALYRGETGGEAEVLPAPVRTFAEHVAREERRLGGPQGEALLGYWREALAGRLQVLELATDRPRPPLQTYRGLSVPFTVRPEPAGAVAGIARERRTTRFTVLLAAFQGFLHRYSGQERFLVGAPAAGRETADVAGVIGYFVNLLPLAADFAGRPTGTALIDRTAGVVAGALAHQALPFPVLAESLQPQRDPSRPPLVQVSFALEQAHRADGRAWSAFALGEEGARAELGGIPVTSVKLAERRVPFELVLLLAETEEGLAGSFQVNADLFDAATAGRMAVHFQNLLAGLAAEPGRAVAGLPLLTEPELRQVGHDWAETAGAAEPFLVHREVARRAAEQPEAPALVGAETMTYGELWRRASALAAFLQHRGIGPEQIVGLYVERSPELVVGALGVLAAGAAYLPLDPAQPVERLRRMLADAGTRVLLTRRELAAGLSADGLETVLLDALDGSAPGFDADLPAASLAYLIYTSGSTGVPKGAAMTHAGLANLVAWHRATYGVTPDDRATLVAGVGFDASVWEMWPVLTAGASLWIPDAETVASPPDLLAWFAAQRITLAFLPTPLAEAVLSGPTPPGLALRALLTGGDRLLTRPGAGLPFALVNHYGPTEGTVVATAGRVRPERGEERAPSIGRPIAGARVTLVDRDLQPVPVGVAGEILLGGAGLARGYLGHPRMTAEVFVPAAGGRAYRTGDLARWLPDGRIEFIGRRDHQVKIRGIRIELGEVEAALRDSPHVREAVVLARSAAAGRMLVACVVAEGEPGAGVEELRAHLRERLPEAMVPAAFLLLPALPVTPNGKVDREALARLPLEEAPAASLRTGTEERLGAIWREVLGLPRIGAEDDFFHLGGHSLLASRVGSRVREAFGVELPLAAFFEHPQLAALAAAIDAARGLGDEDVVLEPQPRRSEMPLSFAQERLWFLDRLEPGSAVYNIPAVLRLCGPLDAARLEQALAALEERHEALRTSLPARDGRPFQRIHPLERARRFTLERIDSTGAADPAAEALRLARQDAARPFDLATGPLWRAALVRLGESEHLLLLNLHHSISDGWSMDVLAHDLSVLGAGEALAPLPVQYADYAVWQRKRLTGPVLDRLLAGWRQSLAGAPAALELPTDKPRPASQSYRGTVETLILPALRAGGATLFMTVLAALAAVLHRWSGQDAVVIGSPVAGRERRELEGLIGFFVNALPLGIDLAGDPPFSALVRRTLRATVDAHAGAEVPFEKLVEELRPVRDLSRSPLFQVLLTVQAGGAVPLRLPGITVEPVSPAKTHGGTAKFDLTFALVETGSGLEGGIEYATDLFDAATIRRLAGHLGVLLTAAVADPACRLGDLPLLTAAEERQALAGGNAPAAPEPAVCGLHELFEEQARRTPEATAVIWGTERISYGDLNRRADAVAADLLADGLMPEERVGVSMPRTPDLLAALLGVLKAGGAYVPVDPAYPQERREFLLADSGATRTARPPRTDTDGHGRSTDTPEGVSGVRESPCPSVPVRVQPGRLAYLIYTSGSTGTPKGVGVRHASALARVAWAAAQYPAQVWRGVLAATSINFDLSVFEIFVPLSLGGTVILADDALALPGLPAAGEVTLLNTVPSALAELLRLGAVPPSVRVVNLAGEALRRELADAVLALPQAPELWNLYGPSEDTTYSTGARIERGTEAPPIGRPLPGSRAYVLDGYGRLAPAGVPGELWLGGVGLARGYLGRPDLTADRFRPDPFIDPADRSDRSDPSDALGSRLYRTGDLVRRRPDGLLDYLGRLDQQVKVRGFRVELGEIEAALGAHPAVAEAVVVAPEGADGVRRLLAWIVAAGPADAEELRRHLAARLPAHMVPAIFTLLPEMPRTPNGKVDRKALAARAVHGDPAETAEPPRTPAEIRLAAVWSELLGVAAVGREDSFFALGGHSLQAARLTARVRDAFAVEVPVRAVFERSTLAAFAALIDELAAAEGRVVEPPAAALPRDGRDLPLSFAQERLWFLDQLESGTAFYNIPTAVRLRGPLQPELFRRALEEVVQRHEALRTTFGDVQGRPVQIIAPALAVELPLLDLSGLPAAAAEAEMHRQAGAEISRPFDLATGPLFRAFLLRLAGTGEHVAVLNLHHIIADGWSLGVLIREISALYAAFLAAEPSPLPPLPIQYADFAVWQRRHLQGPVFEDDVAWWRGRLAGVPGLTLPTDRPRPAVEAFRGKQRSTWLSAELTRDLGALARSERATLFMVLLAAFQALLARSTGQADIPVGSPVANRGRSEVEGLIGFFANTLVLRTDLSGRPGFRALLGRVREVTLAASAHDEIPFEKLVEEIQPERDMSRNPLFQVMLVLQNQPWPAFRIGDVALEPFDVNSGTAKFDLTIFWREQDGRLVGLVEHNTDLYDDVTVTRFVRHYEALLGAALGDLETPVAALPLLTAAERHQLVVEWNGTWTEYAEGRCIHHRVEEQAARTPQAVAVYSAGRSLTYAELNARANRLAHGLRGLGVGPESLVGICVERGVEMVVAMLAVLKAGGAGVALDPAYPRERLAFILREADLRVLLTQTALAGFFPEGAAERLLLDPDVELFPEESAENPRSGVSLDNPIYAIYTSGSTGQPKGILVTHRAFSNLLDWQLADPALVPAARTVQFATFGFCVSFQEMFSSWGSGGALVLADEMTRRDIPGLTRFLEESEVERLHLPFAALKNLSEVAAGQEVLPRKLQEVITAGEQLQVTPAVRNLFARLPGCTLSNQYGASETHVISALTLSGDPAGWMAIPPVGRPIANVRIHLLDADLEPVPIGVAGELFAAGACVARGYLDDPVLSAQKMIPDPFSTVPGSRMYRTGDAARYLADGRIEYHGRLDTQVKIRGFRVELGEIDTVLARHPGVRDAAVVARAAGGEAKRLVAYVVPTGEEADFEEAGFEEAGFEEIRAWLKKTLPEYMVPAAFVRMDRLPLNANGKLDQAALPEPEARSAAAYIAPRTAAEEVIAGIWAEVLRLDRVSAGGDFFELGGHSLLATQVVSRVRAAFGVELALRTLFEAPRVSELAARVEALRSSQAPAPPLRPAAHDGPPPLSFAQERLWFLDQLEPGSAAYNMPGALELEGPLDPGALRAALAAVVARHEALRTTFELVADNPRQRIHPAADAAVPLIDLSGCPPAARSVESERLTREQARVQFDLARGPLLAALLVRLEPGLHRFLVTMHHIVSDGWSVGVLVREVAELYAAAIEKRPAALPPLPVQVADVAVWQREWLVGDVLGSQLAWWRERLAGAPAVLDLPADRPRPAVASYRGATVPLVFGPGLVGALQKLARREGATLFMTLLAGFQALLARLTGAEDLVTGTAVAGRNRLETERLIGLFVNSLALRTGLAGDPDVRGLIARARETALGATAHQDVPFERLVEELQPERSLAQAPLFQVMLILQNTPAVALEAAGLRLRPLGEASGTAKLDLTLALEPREDGGLAGTLEYATDLFDAATLHRFAGHLETLLAAAVADPAQRLSALPLLTARESAQLAGEWNDTATPFPLDRPFPALFAERAAAHPDAVAAVCNGESVSYGALWERAGRLAGALAAAGVGPETVVPILMRRGLDFLTGVLAIWATGGAYLPLDPAHPRERQARILEGSGARLGLVVGEGPEVAGLRWLVLEDLLAGFPLSRPGGERWERGPGGEVLAYVIFTSGSTGVPKGAMLTHRGMLNHLWANAALRGLTAADRMAQTAGHTFDISVWQHFTLLLVGGRVVIYPDEIAHDPGRLLAAAGRDGITAMELVPSLLRLAVEELEEGRAVAPRSLRWLVSIGEALPTEVAAGWLRHAPWTPLVNAYGPTECSDSVSHEVLTAPPATARPWVALGRPIPNLRLHVVDRELCLQPVGVPGELAIAGTGVGRGYLGDGARTADAFRPNPFGDPTDRSDRSDPSDLFGGRLYRTGDLARRRPDGVLDYLGRLDHQVKVRGYRVELGEIEATLGRHPGVRQAVVLALAERLVAFLVPNGGEAPDAAAVRAFLAPLLPAPMVPAELVVLPELPLNANGKVDRRALRERVPGAAAPAGERRAPATATERTLAAVWSAVLECAEPGRDDHFFALGGHSLAATRVVSRLRRELGVELPVRALFEAPVLADLAARIEALAGGPPTAAPLRRIARDTAPPLSFSQQRLWFLDQLEPGSPAYNMPMALRLDGALDRATLARSLAAVVARHEVLRTTFDTPGDAAEPVQRIAPPEPVALPCVDLAGLADPDAEVRRLTRAEARRPFDLRRGPLLRATLLRLEDAAHVLLFTMHHIVSDGWSLRLLVREIAAFHATREPLPPLPFQYADFALWQRELLAGPAFARQLGWWRERLHGAPPALDLPADHPRPGQASGRGTTRTLAVPPEATQALSALGRREGASLFMVLLAAFAALVTRITGEDDLVLGTEVANRNREETEELIGFFVNQLPLRVDAAGDPAFPRLLARVREMALGAYAHQDLPFERLVEELRPERDLSRQPVFQVSFTLQNLPAAPLALPGLTLRSLPAEAGAARIDFALEAVPVESGLLLRAEASTDLFEPVTVDRMLHRLATLLAAVAETPQARLSALVLLLPAEEHQIRVKPLRRALALLAPVSGRERGVEEPGRVPPRDALERTLAEIWSEVLETDRFGVHDDFFALGGHSLLATRVMARVRHALGIDLPLATLFSHPTVAGLATAARGHSLVETSAGLHPVPRDRELAPSAAQQRLWFIDQLQPGSPLWDIAAGWRLTGRLDVAALTAAVEEIVRRHETLRTVFPAVAGRPVQQILPPDALCPAVSLIDLTALAPERRDLEGLRLATAHGAFVFDLARGPLLALHLVRRSAEEHLLLFNVHHIVADGWSEAIFQDELAALYAAAVTGVPAGLPELPVQYADWAAWQEERLAAGALDGQLAVWRERLAGAREDLELPFDRPRPASLSGRGALVDASLPAGLAGSLAGLARQSRVSLFTVVLAAFEALLARLSTQEDFSIGTAVAGRRLLETEPLIGYFVNTLVLRADVAGDPPFTQMVHRAQAVVAESQENQDLPFDRLVDALQPERSLAHAPFFQVMLLFQNLPAARRTLPGLAMEALDLHSGTAKSDLLLALAEAGDGLAGTFEYSTDLFDRATIERTAGHFRNLCAGLAATPAARVFDLPLLAPEEIEQMVTAPNRSASGETHDLWLHQLVERQALRDPQVPAVVCDGEALSYGDLVERAGRLARHLRALGVGPEVRVGLLLERSLDLAVAILGVLQAGGAFVPLDPAHPAERRAAILEDAAAALVVTHRGLAATTSDGSVGSVGSVRCLRLEDLAGPGEPPPPLDTALRSHGALAYTIFTSGSTGRPKGVMIPHRSVVHLAETAGRWLTHPGHEVWTLFHSYAFDFSVWEMWACFAHGGTLVVVPLETAQDPLAFHDLLARERVTVLHQTPAALRQLLGVWEDGARDPAALALRRVGCGGEALPCGLAEQVLGRWTGDFELWNFYGPTEVTVWGTAQRVTLAEARRSAIPLGAPLPDARVYVLDPALGAVPSGVAGEICIGGFGPARGYAGRPELTAEKLVPDPFSGVPGARLYRTGDLGRRRADGSLEYAGRIDFQVKVRGFRVELKEIEAVLAAVPGVRQAVVLLSGERLTACLGGSGLEPAALRAALAAQLPAYMVPSAFVLLPALPLTANGKVDRRALARLEPAAAEPPAGDLQAPRTPAEEIVAAAWREVLGIERVGLHDSFFESGGHSLLATRVVSRLREAFGVEVPLRALFETPTVAGLAQAVEELSRKGEGIVAPPLRRMPRDPAADHPAALAPLSFAQEWMWLIDQLDPTRAAFGVPLAVRLHGTLDPAALGRALQEVVGRHEVLRTTFPVLDGRPVQRIAPPLAVPLPLVDLTGHPAEEEERWIDAALRRPLDLARGPLVRALLLRRRAAEHTLVLDFHHILFDGWSGGVLVRELATLYRAFTAGEASPLPELPVQVADHAVWQRGWLQGAALDRLLAWWKERLAGPTPQLDLPGARRGGVATLRGARRRVELGAELSAALQALTRREGVTLFVALLAAWQAVLHRLTRETDLRIGAPVAGRNRPELEGLIGYFVNTLVMRTDLGGDPSFRELLARAKETALGAWAHQDLPFTRLVEELQPDRSAGRTPLFQVMLILQNTPVPSIELPGLSLVPADRETPLATFDLTLVLAEEAGGLGGWLWYNRDLLEGDAVAHLFERFRVLLAGATAAADHRLSALPLVTEAERRQLLEGRPAMSVAPSVPPAAEGDLLPTVFEARVDAEPDAVALVWQGAETTYDDLDRAANRLARRLRALGVGPETRVGLCLERSPRLPAAILAVLKAGGAWLPLDPAYPAERLAFLLADSGAQVLVTESAARGHLPDPRVPVIDLDDPGLAAESEERPGASGAVPANLAYVIYTSGSTGQPKGVQITHANVLRLLAETDDVFRFDERDTWTLFHSYAFDFSVWEMWGALLSGGRLVIVPREVARSPEDFHALLREEKVTVLNQTPSAFSALLQVELAQPVPAHRKDLPLGALRHVIFGGEALQPALLKPWVERYGDPARRRPRLVNMYGITETTVHVTHRALAAADLDAGSVIGEPIADLTLHLLDEHLQPVPAGVPGELWVGGAGLARGYLGRPDLTAERFLPNPFVHPTDPSDPSDASSSDSSTTPGARLYRTGDLARRGPDGQLEYLGRADGQVKIRGFRIEPGEIEAALLRHPGVAEAVVVAREDPDGDRKLVAYLVPDARTAAPVRNLLRLEREGRLAGHGTFELPNGLVVVHQHEGVTLGIYREIFEGEVYRRHGLELPPGACVFDVGANLGLFTLWVGRTVPAARIFSFEPIPATAEVLALNAALHGLDATVYAAGIADSERSEVFTYYPFFSSTSGRFPDLGKDRADIKAHILNEQRQLDASAFETWRRERETALDRWLDEHMQSEKVACRLTTISAVIREHGLERIDLLKLDAERSELDALAGIHAEDWPKIHQMVIEVHDAGIRDRVLEVLAAQGFATVVEQDVYLEGTELYNVYARRPGGLPARAAIEAPAAARWASPSRLLDDVRHLAAESLPEHMVPAAWVGLAALPLTAHGKVDRRALPAPRETARTERPIVEPRTPVESELVAIWRELLKVERISIYDNFFELGGHSLLLTQLASRLRTTFQVELPLRILFDVANVVEMTEAIAGHQAQQVDQTEMAAMLDELKGLSPEEIRALLEAEG